MRAGLWRNRLIMAVTTSVLLVVAADLHANDGMDQARALAEQFAKAKAADKSVPAGAVRTIQAIDPPSAADEQRLVEEIDMLERARAEAEARREALVKEREAAETDERRAEDGTAAKAEAKRRADEAERQIAAERDKAAEATRQSAEARRKIEDIERHIAEERERAEAAVREAADVKRQIEAAEQRLAAERQRSADAVREAEAARRLAEEARLADERSRADARLREAEARQKALADVEMARMAAEREAEAQRIEAALQRARDAREARNRNEAPPSVGSVELSSAARPDLSRPDLSRQETSGPTRSPAETARDSDRPLAFRAPAHQERHRTETRVAILMLMEIGNRGIRRTNKSADPILCGERGCYVSAGADEPAELLPMRRAFGAGRTLGSRAGACRNSTGCVFRDVDLVAFPAIVQPVDMRFLKHDRRQPQALHEASDCSLEAGRLACAAIHGPDYTMWVVPETLAREAGPAELARVVEAGLSSEVTARR